MKRHILFIILITALLTLACGGVSLGAEESAATDDIPATDSVSESVSQPEAASTTAPDLTKESGWYIYSNANEIKSVAQYQNQIYTGGPGGLVAWSLEDGSLQKYTTLDGLSHISVHTVAFCNMPEPRIVIGHETGVDLFDPANNTFERLIVPDESESLNGSQVGELYCDEANNRLLIGYSGIGVYDFNTNIYKRYTTDDGLSWNGVSDIGVVDGDIWIANGYNGVNVIKGDQITVYNEANGMPSERALSVASTKDGTVWVGTSSGLLSFKGGKWTLLERENSGVPGEVNNLFAAQDGTLWLSTYPIGTGVICQLDPASQTCTFKYEYPRGGIADFAVTDRGVVFGTRHGLQIFVNGASEAEPRVIAEDQKLFSNFVDSLALDSNGMLWVGTSNGIHVVDPANPDGEWTKYGYESGIPNTPGGNWASNLIPGESGAMWAVITNGSLSYFDGAGKWKVYDQDGFYSVTALATDFQGRVWLSDDDKPVLIIENDVKTLEYSVADGLPERNINTLFRDGDTMWIGGSGLSRFRNGQIELLFTKDDIRGSVLAMTRDSQGDLLIATSGSILSLDENDIPIVLLKGEFGSDVFGASTSISSMALDSQGTIYVGTYDGLLVSADGGSSWKKLTTQDGLSTDNINTVFVDQFDTLWVGGGHSTAGGGLMRYVP